MPPKGKVTYVTVGSDKPLAHTIVFRCLSVDKSQVLQSGMLDTPFSHCVLPLKNGLTQELKIVFNSQSCVSIVLK